MADFEKALKYVLSNEGGKGPHQVMTDKNVMLLCSDCFKDEGLRIDAYKIGIVDNSVCPNCKSKTGHKLNKELVHTLSHRFFVRGTIHKTEYGGSPVIQFNEQRFTKSEIDVPSWLIDDVKLLEKVGEIGFFYYGPRLWMVGEVEPLTALQNNQERKSIINRILEIYPTKHLTPAECFYRIRKSPTFPTDFSEYDSPPDRFLGKFRFDTSHFPVLYGSPDLELCIHECRTTVEDNLYVAKLVPSENIRLLDLSVLVNEGTTEFESIDIAIHFLFLAGGYSYEICREIAVAAKDKGFQGIIYPSYFSYMRTGAIPFETIYGISIRQFPDLKDYAQSQSIPNVAIFGRPIKDGRIVVKCINKVVINKVTYDLTFGPPN